MCACPGKQQTGLLTPPLGCSQIRQAPQTDRQTLITDHKSSVKGPGQGLTFLVVAA